MTKSTEVGVAAAVGGVSPSIIALAVELVTNHNAEIPTRPGYYLGLLLFAAIGFFVARIWREKVPKTAFFLGVGLPAMFQVGTGAIHKHGQPQIVQPSRATTKSSNSWLQVLSTTAYAQAAPRPVAVSTDDKGRNLHVTFESVPSDTRFVFTRTDGKAQTIFVNWEKAAVTGAVLVRVPDDAQTVKIVSALTRNTPTIDLRSTPGQALKLRAESDSMAEFLRALGFDATDELKVTAVPMPTIAQQSGTSPPIPNVVLQSAKVWFKTGRYSHKERTTNVVVRMTTEGEGQFLHGESIGEEYRGSSNDTVPVMVRDIPKRQSNVYKLLIVAGTPTQAWKFKPYAELSWSDGTTTKLKFGEVTLTPQSTRAELSVIE